MIVVFASVMVTRRCPACDGEAWVSLGDEGVYRWVRCASCRTAFTPTPVGDEALAAVYRSYYSAGGVEVASEPVQERLEEVVASWAPHRRTGRVLDVGFGGGDLLRMAATQGWECWGTELAEDALAAGTAEGWVVRKGDLRTADLPIGGFDVVALVEVLEHLQEPEAYLRRAGQLLGPGGRLWGTTPNASSLNGRMLGVRWSVVAPPEHLQLFSPGGLTLLLERCSFQGAVVRSRGFNPSELVHDWRGRLDRRKVAAQPVDRAAAAAAINARLHDVRGGRAVKRGVNGVLGWSGLGDTLAFEALSTTRPAQP